MTIVRKVMMEELEELATGDTFEYNNNLYLKLNVFEDSGLECYNALNLNTMEFALIDEDNCVKPINMQLVEI